MFWKFSQEFSLFIVKDILLAEALGSDLSFPLQDGVLTRIDSTMGFKDLMYTTKEFQNDSNNPFKCLKVFILIALLFISMWLFEYFTLLH